MRVWEPVVLCVWGLAGCTHREPPAPDVSPSIALPEVPAPKGSASSASNAPAPSTSGASAAAASASTIPSPFPSGSAGVDPATLPQTPDRPVASGPAFDARVHALWDAVVADDPERALPFFFPLGAYQQVKDVGDPASDWRRRLVAAYKHDIHALHARLGGDPSQAKLVGVEVPEARARWVDPGEEYNKIGYFRVFGTRMRYEVEGKARSFDVKSLISWRGEWYVVHLSAIQ
jgi:hypothetical protein